MATNPTGDGQADSRVHDSYEDLARWCLVQTQRSTPRVIVGAAIIEDGRVLACARSEPPEFAGRWEFPGGKVEPGESEVEALIRECVEELGVKVTVGARVGADVALAHGWAILRVYAATLVDDVRPQLLEHADMRWLGASELGTVDWLPADAPIVAALRPILHSRGQAPT
jgi:8-oxo-dGTP diphosphatase